MTAESQEAKSALDAVEEDVELGRSEPDELLPRLATILLSLQTDSPHRPRAHRLLGVVDHRMKLASDAFRELHEAKTLAETESPPDRPASAYWTDRPYRDAMSFSSDF